MQMHLRGSNSERIIIHVTRAACAQDSQPSDLREQSSYRPHALVHTAPLRTRRASYCVGKQTLGDGAAVLHVEIGPQPYAARRNDGEMLQRASASN